MQSHSLTNKLELFISCRDLKDMDTFSKSDPLVQVFEKNPTTNAYKLLGQTEVIWDNLNPDFVQRFLVDFHFEEQQYLLFKVWDVDNKEADLTKSDFIGEALFTLGEVVSSPGQSCSKVLKAEGKTDKRGKIIIRVEEMNEDKEIAVFDFSGQGIENVTKWYSFSHLKPMLHLSRSMENGSWQKVYSSEHIRDKSPNWKPFEISVQHLCNNDYSRPLLFEVFAYHSNGSHDLIGSNTFTLQDLTEKGIKKMEIIDEPRKKKKKSYTNSGYVVVDSIDIRILHTFLEYVSGGCEICLTAAVDYTQSNGDIDLPGSLHKQAPNSYNDYEKALFSVGEILLNYDSDKLVPFFGFGGKIRGQISHCFAINGNEANSEVYGLEGMMAAYKESFNFVHLSGPTLFSQVISSAIQDAQASDRNIRDKQRFHVLLILTDGEIHDMRDTIDLIVKGSELPLGIVIVGIGNDQFENMVILDADDDPLVDRNGKKMVRDIVQFVPFRNVGNSPSRLCKEVLEEIPEQLLSYFKLKNIKPNPPRRDLGHGAYNRANTLSDQLRMHNEVMGHVGNIDRSSNPNTGMNMAPQGNNGGGGGGMNMNQGYSNANTMNTGYNPNMQAGGGGQMGGGVAPARYGGGQMNGGMNAQMFGMAALGQGGYVNQQGQFQGNFGQQQGNYGRQPGNNGMQGGNNGMQGGGNSSYGYYDPNRG